MTETLLATTNLTKSFGRRTVVTDVNLHIGAEEVVGLLGPNGAGKSTIFAMIAGLIAADRGSVTLDGQGLAGLPLEMRARLGLGYLAQDTTIFRGMTVEENLRVPLEAMGLGVNERNSRLAEALAEFELEPLRQEPGQTLSGGERRRVEMARALILDPKVMLLDEPFAGVDPIATEMLRGFVESLKTRGIGVLITDHNVRETLSICDRAYIIADGAILIEGTPSEIVENPLARSRYLGEKFRV